MALAALFAGAEIFRLGFFADDFHFLDVARRVPLLSTLGGQYGIYPWYRPLSREIFFAGVALAGPAAAALAHLLSLSAVMAGAFLLDRIGRRLVGPRAGRIAALLFATYEFTRFLAAWASGFQDLLGLLLVLVAIDAWLSGRRGWALGAAALASFAKETSLVVFPLLGGLVWIEGEAKRRWRYVAALGGVLAAVLLVHLAVRASWPAGGSTAHIEFTPTQWRDVMTAILSGFVGRVPVLEPWAVVWALLTAAAAGFALADRSLAARTAETGPVRLAFVAGAAAVGFLPLAAGQLLRVSAAHAYYGFAAAPWIALLLGAAIARLRSAALVSVLVVGLCGWNVLALGYRAPDLATQSGWNFQRWDWREAMRLSAISARLEDDLRGQFAARPESLVICYTGLPAGSFFQTEDGPATRVSLDDPGASAYWVNAVPYAAASHPVVLVEFNPASLHLRRVDPATQPFDRLAAASVASGDPGPAMAFSVIAGPPERRTPEMWLFRSAAALLAEGPGAYVRELAAAGLADSLGAAPREVSERLLGRYPELRELFEDALRHPRSADRHVALGRAYARMKGWVSAAVELRVARALEPRPMGERFELASALEQSRDLRSARRELEGIAAAAAGTPDEAEARRRIADLDRLGAAEQPKTPVRALGKPAPPLDTPR